MPSSWRLWSASSDTHPIIKYSNAVERLGSETVSRLSLAFNRAKGNEAMTKPIFHKVVLGETFPKIPYLLWTQLFNFIDSNKRQKITLKSFLCAAAVIMKGTQKEQLKLCFYIFNLSGSGLLSKEELKTFIELGSSNDGLSEKSASVAVSPDGQPYSAEEFLQYVLKSKNSHQIKISDFCKSLRGFSDLVILRWIQAIAKMLESIVNIAEETLKEVSTTFSSPQRAKSVQLDSTEVSKLLNNMSNSPKGSKFDDNEDFSSELSTVVPLSDSEVESLRQGFYSLRVKYGASQVDVESICSALDTFSREHLTNVYNLLTEKKESVTLREYIFAILCHCAVKWKDIMSLYFILFDLDRDGLLSKKELADLILYIFSERRGELMSYGEAKILANSAMSYETMKTKPSISSSSSRRNSAPSTLSQTTNAYGNTAISVAQFLLWMDVHPEGLRTLKRIRCIVHVKVGTRPYSAESERHFIASMLCNFDAKQLGRPGTVWYLVSARWWKKWLRHVNLLGSSIAFPDVLSSCELCSRIRRTNGFSMASFSSLRHSMSSSTSSHRRSSIDENHQHHDTGCSHLEKELESIDNSCLLVEKGGAVSQLSLNVIFKTHYVLLNFECWMALSSWYGGGPEICRSVIDSDGIIELELYPLVLHVYFDNGSEEEKECKIISQSKMTSVKDLRQSVGELFPDADIDSAKIWERNPEEFTSWEILSEPSSEDAKQDAETTLMSLQLAEGHHLLVEVPDSKTKKFRRRADSSISEDLIPEQDTTKTQPSQIPNVVGLYNLGNTCFMNSALQCLLQTPILSQYFATNEYLYDINERNPLGMGGCLAAAYGSLLKEISEHSGKGKSGAIAPRLFKQAIGKFSPQFEGIQQQDAQELLSVLLNGLSEDLSRLQSREKPYSELPDSNKMPDTVLAKEWWKNYIMRDPSIITALLSGQFKSLLACTKCKTESARFEPFSFLQLPLPASSRLKIQFTLNFLRNTYVPLKLSLVIERTKTVSDLLSALCDLKSLDPAPKPRDLVLVYQSDNNVQEIISQYEKVSTLADRNDLVVFWVDDLPVEFYYEDGGVKSPTLVKKGDLVLARVQNELFALSKVVTASENNISCQVLELQNETPDDNIIIEGLRESDVLDAGAKHAIYIKLVNRRMEYAPFYFAEPLRMKLFNQPFVLRVVSGEITGNDLYEIVKQLLARLLDEKLEGITALSPHTRKALQNESMVGTLNKSPKGTANSKVGNHPESDAITNENRQRAQSTFISVLSEDGEESSGITPKELLEIEKFGFRLSRVSTDGTCCSKCTWEVQCKGCVISPSAETPLNLKMEEVIGIDWGDDMLHRCNFFSVYDVCYATENSSVAKDSLDLSDCLNNFVSKENLTAFCSKCTATKKSYQETIQTKVLRLWAVPPVLIVQVKRFQMDTDDRSWLKSNTCLDFPINGLDLKEFLASAENETSKEGDDSIVDPQFGDNGFPNFTLSRQNTSYNLYGVVNHIGGLAAGHYTAFVKTEQVADDDDSTTWWGVDDSYVEKISISQINPSRNAYLLFYVRSDLRGMSLEEIYPRAGDSNGAPCDALDLRRKLSTWKKDSSVNDLNQPTMRLPSEKSFSPTSSVASPTVISAAPSSPPRMDRRSSASKCPVM